MSVFAESLKRLYETGQVTQEQVAERVAKGTVTEEEYREIVGDGDDVRMGAK